MPKALSRNESLQLANLINEIPQPSVEHIAKCKIAAIECRSIKDFYTFLQVDRTVFKHWVNTNIEFRKAFRSWRDFATEEVEFAVAKKAVGFTKRTRKQILTRQGQVVELIQEEYFPPDSSAQGMWLKNRNGKEWKDTQQIDVNVQTNIRAWLINAMEDGPKDETEVIDVTPQLIEAKEAEAELEAVTETVEQEAQRLAAAEQEQDTDSRALDRPPEPAADIAAINARWGS